MSDEQETIDNLKAWWEDNGRYVIAGLVLGVAALVGWQQWNAYTDRTAEAAGQVYASLKSAADADRRNEAESLLEQLVDDYPRSAYTDQAGLVMARLYMDRSEPEAAAEALQRIVDHSRDRELKSVAALRLARVLHHLDDSDGALAALDQARGEAFAARVAEVRGDVLASRGDYEGARAAYELALARGERGVINRDLVRIKRDDLPVDAAAPVGEDA